MAFAHKHNQVLTLGRQVLCHTTLEIVALIGWECALRGMHAVTWSLWDSRVGGGVLVAAQRYEAIHPLHGR